MRFAPLTSARVNVTCHERLTAHTTTTSTVTTASPSNPRVRRRRNLRSRQKYPIMSAPTIAPAPSSVALSARVGPSNMFVLIEPWYA